jgi:hypothetical protein
VIRACLVMSFHAGPEFGLVAPRDNRVNQPITAAISQIGLSEAEGARFFWYAGNVK